MRFAAALIALSLLAAPAAPALAQTEVAATFDPVTAAFDHVRTEVEIPMRDGTRLHTVIVRPKALANGTKAPIILTRTPYGADKATIKASSPRVAFALNEADGELVDAGYIRVFQDIRGRYGSEGEWRMTQPVRGPLNDRPYDQTTDTWDTIDWLVKNVPDNNGRVGVTGVSYPGWLTLMSMLDPHPALKAAVPQYPMVDGWIGDDFYHNGALRQTMFEWIYTMGSSKTGKHQPPFGWRDLYDAFLDAGSADAFAARYGAAGLATWRKVVDNPAYTAFWQGQAVDRLLAQAPLKVPTLIVHGLFDQEDNYGALAAYRVLEEKDAGNDMVFLAVGPWSHGQSQADAGSLGAVGWDAATGRHFRRDMLMPFFDEHLKGKAPARPIPPVRTYDTGTRRWAEAASWPAAQPNLRLYFGADGRLGVGAPPAAAPGGDGKPATFAEYVSDPRKPVPYRVRPILSMRAEDSTWSQWLVDDQRPFSDRPDVLTFVSEPLTDPVSIRGAVQAVLNASTTGTDADWVVKLIDVYPPEYRPDPKLGGYQLMVSGDIMRGRYRETYAQAKAITPGKVAPYAVRLPEVDHTFLPGHRIMVQVQSSWFPLYDRNPQTFVDNIAKAKPADYRAATQRVFFAPGRQSFVEVTRVGR